MRSPPKSVPQLLREEIPNVPTGKQPIRLLICGIPKGVESIVNLLHVLGFAFIWGMEPASTVASSG
ncbi:hypothetical protein QUA43_13715 [Microcoleus sp. N9_B4]|uniref:hypothetical protein n=1 Tax=Microcoleus sp. N9_B4 TaxID=3055386 RepID=UPI002FD0847F